MADFSFLSDSDDEKTVDEIISQAEDQIVLEQIAAINCSGFTDSVLPAQLETRFQKLKSFPASSNPKSSSLRTYSTSSNGPKVVEFLKTKSRSQTFDAITESNSAHSDENSVEEKRLPPHSDSLEDDIFPPSKQNPEGKKLEKLISQTQNSVFEEKTESNSDFDSDCRSVEKDGDPYTKSSKDSKLYEVSVSSWDSSTRSPSPPQKSGCFWCSPIKVSRKKISKGDNSISGMDLKWEKDDGFLSDLNSFSAKNQQKLMKKVMKEEEKINREAEKIIKWAKQGSARMDVLGFEDELTDNEHFK